MYCATRTWAVVMKESFDCHWAAVSKESGFHAQGSTLQCDVAPLLF